MMNGADLGAALREVCDPEERARRAASARAHAETYSAWAPIAERLLARIDGVRARQPLRTVSRAS